MALASLYSATILSILSTSEMWAEPQLFLLGLFSVIRVTREAWVVAHQLLSASPDLIIPTTRCSLRVPLPGYQLSTASTRSSRPDLVSALLLPDSVDQQLAQLVPSGIPEAQDPAEDPNALLLKFGTRTIPVLGRPKEPRWPQTPLVPVQAVHLHLPRVCKMSRPSTPRMLWRVIWEIRALRAIRAIQAVQAIKVIKSQQEELSKRYPHPRLLARMGEACTGIRECLTSTSQDHRRRPRE
jgi:hypothetical protein